METLESREKKLLFQSPFFQVSLLNFMKKFVGETSELFSMQQPLTDFDLVKCFAEQYWQYTVTEKAFKKTFPAFVQTPQGQDFLRKMFTDMDDDLSMIQTKQQIIIEILRRVPNLNTDLIDNSLKRKGAIVDGLLGLSLDIQNPKH